MYLCAIMYRYFLEVLYDGTAFYGSQLQGNLPTVQLALNQSLSTLLRRPVETYGASRTDEGVHALGNVYHFDYPEILHPQFLYNLNAILPKEIAVHAVYQNHSEEKLINARFDAIDRTYRYRIYQKKNPFYFQKALYYPFRIQQEILQETASLLMQYTSFATFSKRNTQTRTFICHLYESYWENHEDQLHYVVKANRFLRGMVRGLVGTQLLAARGKINLKEFKDIIESEDCTRADFSVAGHGLYLEKIRYPEGTLLKIF